MRKNKEWYSYKEVKFNVAIKQIITLIVVIALIVTTTKTQTVTNKPTLILNDRLVETLSKLKTDNAHKKGEQISVLTPNESYDQEEEIEDTFEETTLSDVSFQNEENRDLVSSGSAGPTYPDYVTSVHTVPNWDSRCRSACFSYMGYQSVTCKTSRQYALLNSERAYTDPATKIRMVDGRYCIALAQGWGFVVGDYVDVVLENGSIVHCIMGDAKSSLECDENQQFHLKGDCSVVEVILDYSVFQRDVESPMIYHSVFDGRVLELWGVK